MTLPRIPIATAALCKTVCNALAAAYGIKLRYGPSSSLVRAVASALDLLGITDRSTFLRSCSILIDDTAYLPFRVGSNAIPFYSQVAVVAHECQHAAQADGCGGLWLGTYFGSRPDRAAFEMQAYAVSQEVIWRTTGVMPDARKLAEGMKFYQLRRDDIDYCARALAMKQGTLRRGGQSCKQIEVIARAVMGE